jgi:hypothetical protein
VGSHGVGSQLATFGGQAVGAQLVSVLVKQTMPSAQSRSAWHGPGTHDLNS